MIIFDPERLSTWIESILNNQSQETLTDKIVFKVDTLYGKYDTNYLKTINNNKTNYVYAIISDPTGDLNPIKGLAISSQRFVLHMFFKMDQRKHMYKIINNLMTTLCGGYFELPGSEGTTKDYISTNCSYPLIGDADPHSIKNVDKRNGVEYKDTHYYTDATINIYFSTGKALHANVFRYKINNETIYPVNNVDFSIGTQLDTEQYHLSPSTKATVSATEKDIDLAFYCNENSVLATKLLENLMQNNENYNQNQIFNFEVTYDINENFSYTYTRNVIIKNLSVSIKIGGLVYFSCSMTDADTEVLE